MRHALDLQRCRRLVRGSHPTSQDVSECFEYHVYACKLTDPQRVEVIIRYIDPSTRKFCKTLSGFHSCDWTPFQQSLVKAFRSSIPPHQIRRKKLDHLVEDRSRSRMTCEADVLQYYRNFVCYSLPLVHSHHLTEESRNSAFWYGFHPVDCEILWPRVLAKHPFQPLDIPFPYEDVFDSTCAAFASACLTRSTSRSGRENKNTTLGAYTQTLGVHHIHLGLRNFSAHQTIVSLPCFPIRPRIRNLGTRLHSRRWTMNSSPSPSPCFRSLRRLYFLSL